jgi:hypothetical protein
MGSVSFQPLQLDEVRAGLRQMSDADLLRFGKDAASLCLLENQSGHPPRPVFVVQLEEARGKSRRRHPTMELFKLATVSGRAARRGNV